MPKNAGKPIRQGKGEIIGRPEEQINQDRNKDEKSGNN